MPLLSFNDGRLTLVAVDRGAAAQQSGSGMLSEPSGSGCSVMGVSRNPTHRQRAFAAGCKQRAVDGPARLLVRARTATRSDARRESGSVGGPCGTASSEHDTSGSACATRAERAVLMCSAINAATCGNWSSVHTCTSWTVGDRPTDDADYVSHAAPSGRAGDLDGSVEGIDGTASINGPRSRWPADEFRGPVASEQSHGRQPSGEGR